MTAGDPPLGTAFRDLPHARGAPLGQGRIRTVPADFVVDELLGFTPDGAGDHWLLRLRKTDANTEWVARRLAEVGGVRQADLGYAGLKDRRAVTTQWFSMPRRGEARPDWSSLAGEGIEVLEVHAHRRKLRRGSLAGNRFRIRIRDPGADPLALAERVECIRRLGVPNYFGEQRFGLGGANLARADAFCGGVPGGTGRRPSHHQRGLWLSALRSQVFNEVLAERVRRGDWATPLEGDCLNLAGSRSFFRADAVDPGLAQRCADLDLHPTGPLWGAGEPCSGAQVRGLEERVAARFAGWCRCLERHGLRQERRSLRLPVTSLEARAVDSDLELSFELPAGSYATAVLRELIRWDEEPPAQG